MQSNVLARKCQWCPWRNLCSRRNLVYFCLSIIWINLIIFLYINSKRQSRDGSIFVPNFAIGGSGRTSLFIPFSFPAETKDISEEQFYRPEASKVNAHYFPYMINQPNLCKKNQPYLLIEVHSRPDAKDRRLAIRNTWGSAEHLSVLEKNVSVIFLVANHNDDKENEDLLLESSKYKDIIQEDFTDSYENLPIKSIMGLKWAATFCPQADLVFKTDDDMFIHIEGLLNRTDSLNKTGIVAGALNRGSKVLRGGRWKVPKDRFPFTSYPPYCAGAAYVLSSDMARAVYNMSEYKRSINIEDAYVTGILPKMLGVEPIGLEGFPFWTTRLKPSVLCELLKNNNVGVHSLKPPKMMEAWKALTDPKYCASKDE